MKKRAFRFILGLTCGAALLGGVIWLLTVLLPTHDPRYEGRPLADWIAQLNGPDENARKTAENILTNSVVPELILAADQDSDPAWKLWLVENLNQLPGVAIDYHTAGSRRQWAVYNLGAIGPVAKGAVPFLLNKLKTDHEQQQRAVAAVALGLIKADAETIVPVLIDCLDEEGVREGAANGLGHFGRAASAAVPSLIKMINSANKDEIEAALDALREIEPGAIPAQYR